MTEHSSETKYTRCPHCGLEQWEGYKVCQKCKKPIDQSIHKENNQPSSSDTRMFFIIGALTGGFINAFFKLSSISTILGFLLGGLVAVFLNRNIYGNQRIGMIKAFLGGIVGFILIFVITNCNSLIIGILGGQ